MIKRYTLLSFKKLEKTNKNVFPSPPPPVTCFNWHKCEKPVKHFAEAFMGSFGNFYTATDFFWFSVTVFILKVEAHISESKPTFRALSGEPLELGFEGHPSNPGHFDSLSSYMVGCQMRKIWYSHLPNNWGGGVSKAPGFWLEGHVPDKK